VRDVEQQQTIAMTTSYLRDGLSVLAASTAREAWFNQTSLFDAGTCTEKCFIDFYGAKDNCCDDEWMVADVQIVALVVIALAAIGAPFKAYFLYLRNKYPMHNKTSHNTQTYFGIFALIYDITFLLHGLLKLIGPTTYVVGNPDSNIGVDILFFFNASSYLWITHFILLNSSQFLAGALRIIPPDAREKVSHIVKKVDNRAYFAPVAGTLLSSLPMFTYTSPSHASDMNGAFLFGYWCIFVYQAVLGYALGSMVLIEMRRAVSSDSTVGGHTDTEDKINKAIGDFLKARKINTIKMTLICIVWIIGTLDPMARTGWTYVYMVFYMIVYGTIMHTLRQFWHFKNATKAGAVVPAGTAGSTRRKSKESQNSKYSTEDNNAATPGNASNGTSNNNNTSSAHLESNRNINNNSGDTPDGHLFDSVEKVTDNDQLTKSNDVENNNVAVFNPSEMKLSVKV
jgi:hypothetical protein